jgi:hypothetical protein
MVVDFASFLEMSPTDIYNDWLAYIQSRDPLLKDVGPATFNSILAEAVASQFWVFIQLLKKKVKDSSILTATGAPLSAIVLAMLPEGRYPGVRASGVMKFSRTSAALYDIVIPAGTLCAMTTEAGQLIKFQTTEATTMVTGQTLAYAAAAALNIGNEGNVANNTIKTILSPVIGISNCTNDAPFTGGTDQEADEDLRKRALYTIWVTGKATVPLVQEHVAGVEGVREVKVETLGQGDVLLVVDSEGGIGDPEPAIGNMIRENLAAGCTAPGVLGASLRDAADSFQIGDCSGGLVWVRTLQFLAEETVVPFVYQTPGGVNQNGTITFPAGSAAGYTARATLAAENALAAKILSSSYAGILSFDLFMGLGTYPFLWVAPELQAVDIALELVLTPTPEVGLLTSIEASLTAALAAYRIGDQLEFADLVKYIYIDYTTGRAFSGIDDVSSFEVTCKGETITGFGQKITMDDDERCEPGDINATEA